MTSERFYEIRTKTKQNKTEKIAKKKEWKKKLFNFFAVQCGQQCRVGENEKKIKFKQNHSDDNAYAIVCRLIRVEWCATIVFTWYSPVFLYTHTNRCLSNQKFSNIYLHFDLIREQIENWIIINCTGKSNDIQ